MIINSVAISSLGQKRAKNQDAFMLNEDENIYIVSDGMGGYAGGEIASQISIYSINDFITINRNIPVEQLLDLAIKQASIAIFDRSQNDTELAGMGTTTTVLYLKNSTAYIAQVGDSRAYFFRDNHLWQITDDHSLVNEQVKAGHISREEAKKYKFKNVITRSVGFHKNVEVDIYKMAINANDKFLLCSDGLSNYFDDTEILEVISKNSINDSAKYLIKETNIRGGDDNITVLIVDVEKA
jgi:PPM family protein phosphatase